MLTLRMIPDLPDFERTFPTPTVSSVGGGGMRPYGVWFVGFRRRRGAARHAPAQTHADRDTPKPWRLRSGAARTATHRQTKRTTGATDWPAWWPRTCDQRTGPVG